MFFMLICMKEVMMTAMLFLLAPSLSIGILLLWTDYYLLLSFFTCLCCGKYLTACMHNICYTYFGNNHFVFRVNVCKLLLCQTIIEYDTAQIHCTLVWHSFSYIFLIRFRIMHIKCALLPLDSFKTPCYAVSCNIFSSRATFSMNF